MLKRPPLSAAAARTNSKKPVLVVCLVAWIAVLAFLVKFNYNPQRHQYAGLSDWASQLVHSNHYLQYTSSQRATQQHRASLSGAVPAAAAARCEPDALPSPKEVEAIFTVRWGRRSCLPLRKVCLDQGTVVMYQPSSDGSWPLQDFALRNNHLDFRGYGDTIGIIQYPTPILRPGEQ